MANDDFKGTICKVGAVYATCEYGDVVCENAFPPLKVKKAAEDCAKSIPNAEVEEICTPSQSEYLHQCDYREYKIVLKGS